MKLKELFAVEKITKDHLVNMADESSYWDTASDFILNNWEVDVNFLSEKQIQWAHKILEDMTERRIENRL